MMSHGGVEKMGRQRSILGRTRQYEGPQGKATLHTSIPRRVCTVQTVTIVYTCRLLETIKSARKTKTKGNHVDRSDWASLTC